MKICRLLSIIGMMWMLTACSAITGEKASSAYTNGESMEAEPDLSYSIPTVRPGVLVNQTGYLKNSDKAAVFQGKMLPEEFHVVDVQTGTIVYTGQVEQKGYHSAVGEYTGYGEFSELTAQGEYYIECSTIGRSYSFQIGEHVYDAGMAEALQQIEDTDSESAEEICRAAAALLLSYELYGDSYAGEDVPDLPEIMAAKMQQLLQAQEKGILAEDKVTSAYACAVLAKFSYLYRKFDEVLAMQCLQAAAGEWNLLQKEKTGEEEVQSIQFFAAAELYRASGQYEYRSRVEKYLQSRDDTWEISEAEFYGGMTYISTNRKVNMELCHTFMNCFMNRAEQIVQESYGMQYLSEEGWQQCSTEQLLWNAVLLSVADYIITNQEYTGVIENYQHYFLGRNREAVCYLAGEDCKRPADIGKGMKDHIRWEAYYLFMLSRIVSREESEA